MAYNITPSLSFTTITGNSIPAIISANQFILTPLRVANAYDIPYHNGAGLTIGIVSLDGGFQQSDLDKTLSDLGMVATSVNVVTMNGAQGNYTGNATDLANTLDVYCVAALVPAANINLYVSNLSNAIDIGTYIEWWSNSLQQAVNDGCDVILHSWGIDEAILDKDGIPPDAFWSPFSSATSHNVPVVVGSGDFGSAIVNGATVTEGVLYPASSPDVICVGGTYLQLDINDNRIAEHLESASLDTESTNSGIAGGGGVSIHNYPPDYQVGLTYLQEVPGALGNEVSTFTLTHRGLPDISAAMNDYILYFNGGYVVVSSTHASAGIIAGMIARIKCLTGVSLPTYNYNHILYKNAKNSSLIYQIENEGFNGTLGVLGYSDNTASLIWNPVVGLGVVNGRSLERLVGLKGQTYPSSNFTSRPTSGTTYPR
jgi:subtilase family serine protease